MAIPKKSLTPAKFGLNTMRPISSRQIEAAFTNKIKTLVLSPAIKKAMKNMIDQAKNGTKSVAAQFDGLTGVDIGVLTSDFGEVTGALYKLNSGEGYTAAKFPIAEGNSLIDYYLVKDGLDHPYSAKAQGGGGAPSITNLENKINELSETSAFKDNKSKKALKVLKLIAQSSAYEGNLLVAEYLQLPAYEALISLLRRKDLNTGYTNGIPKQEHLQAAIDACGDFDTCMKEFSSYHNICNFELGNEQTMRDVFAGKKKARYKKWGILHYPITSNVLKWLKDPSNGAISVLNEISSTMSVTQINLRHLPELRGNAKWERGTLAYTEEHFSTGKFNFHAPTSAPNPVGNKIGFRME